MKTVNGEEIIKIALAPKSDAYAVGYMKSALEGKILVDEAELVAKSFEIEIYDINMVLRKHKVVLLKEILKE